MAKAETASEEEMTMNRKGLAQWAYQEWKTHATGIMVLSSWRTSSLWKKRITSELSISQAALWVSHFLALVFQPRTSQDWRPSKRTLPQYSVWWFRSPWAPETSSLLFVGGRGYFCSEALNSLWGTEFMGLQPCSRSPIALWDRTKWFWCGHLSWKTSLIKLVKSVPNPQSRK